MFNIFDEMSISSSLVLSVAVGDSALVVVDVVLVLVVDGKEVVPSVFDFLFAVVCV